MTIHDTAWGAFEMGSEGWAVFAGPKMIVSHLAEDQARSIIAEVVQRLRFRECPVCGRQITVLHEIASHMTGGEPCPGSGIAIGGE